MKTNLTTEQIKEVLVDLGKKFKTITPKILMDKGTHRNIALAVEAGEKGSRLAGPSSVVLTRNVCDHVLLNFIQLVQKKKGWVQMHDGRMFGLTEGLKNEKSVGKMSAEEAFNNDLMCYCNREKPKVSEKAPAEKKSTTKAQATKPVESKKDPKKPTTLDKELRQENKAENKKLKKSIKENAGKPKEEKINAEAPVLEAAEISG